MRKLLAKYVDALYMNVKLFFDFFQVFGVSPNCI